MACRRSPGFAVRTAHVTIKCRILKYCRRFTIDKMTTQGRFKDATIANAKDVFPDPELPATPMILALPQGGE
jgi:hypothetical protein